jgi:hypothetical protein
VQSGVRRRNVERCPAIAAGFFSDSGKESEPN